MSSEQKEFEEWAIECQFCTFKLDDGSYKHDSTSIAFAAWMASRALMIDQIRCATGNQKSSNEAPCNGEQ